MIRKQRLYSLLVSMHEEIRHRPEHSGAAEAKASFMYALELEKDMKALEMARKDKKGEIDT